MSNYPVWWDSTITVYNQYNNPLTQLITWTRHTLNNCFWKYSGDKVTIGEVVLDTNSIICRIPENKNYLPKYKWVQIPNDEMSNYFTLGNGDIIILGNVSDEINEYQSGSRSTDLIAKYKGLQGCMEIQHVSENIGNGRGLPHYLVRGI